MPKMTERISLTMGLDDIKKLDAICQAAGGINRSAAVRLMLQAHGKHYQVISVSTLPHPPCADEVTVLDVKES